MRVLQQLRASLEAGVECRPSGLVDGVDGIRHALLGLPVAADHDLHDPHGSDQPDHGDLGEPPRLCDLLWMVVRMRGFPARPIAACAWGGGWMAACCWG